MNKLFLIDSNSIICRYFFALKKVRDINGNPLGGIYGFCKLVLNILKDNPNASIIANFDMCFNNFRKKIFPEYKKDRVKNPELKNQILAVLELCKIIHLPYDFHEEYEADDLIGSYTDYYNNKEKIIVTTDKDLLQLVDKETKVWNPFTGEIFNETKTLDKMGVAPSEIPMFLALSGDSADKIPGILGIGPKTAIKIIRDNSFKEYSQFDFSNLDLMLKLTTLKKEIEVRIKKLNLEINKSEFQRFVYEMKFNSLKKLLVAI